jgi:hypothetical protein
MSLFRLSTEFLRKQQKKQGSLSKATLPAVTLIDPVAPDLSESRVQTALNALTRYIPTEIVTLFVPTISALVGNTKISATALYWFFSGLTPVILIIVYQGLRRANGEKTATLAQLPWWRMTASTIAFLAWGPSVPNVPLPFYGDAQGAPLISGILAILVSVVLNLFEPWFEPEK